MKKTCRGSITVYCCLCLAVWIACMGVFLESARVRGLVSRIDRTASSAIESVMADYNGTLLERYHIFLLDYGKGAGNSLEAQGRWKTYLKKEAKESMGNFIYEVFYDAEWFAFKKINGSITSTWSLLDKDGELFANQMVQYMKYREIGNIVEALLEQVEIIQTSRDGQKQLAFFWDWEWLFGGEEETTTTNSKEGQGTVVYLDVIANKEVSNQKISPVGLPSKLQGITKEELGTSPLWNEVSKEVLIGEYILEHFTGFTDNCKEEKMRCQLEYILFGQLSDAKNMKELSNLLLVVRSGLNLIALLSSETMQAAAEASAVTISSALLSPELAPLVKIILECFWAYQEAKQDVDALLQGKTVPFLKDEAQWIESVLSFGQSEEAEDEMEAIQDATEQMGNEAKEVLDGFAEIGKSKGGLYTLEMSYEDYIRIFLLFLPPETKYYRAMDMIQVQMQREYANFQIADCICGLEAKVDAKGVPKFLFFQPNSVVKQYDVSRTVSFLY